MTSVRRAGNDLAVFLPVLMATAVPTWWLFALPVIYLLEVLAFYALLVGLVVRSVPVVLPGQGLGAANRVTLGRATLLLPITALTLHPENLGDPLYWWIIAVCSVAMVLDGVDGWMARQTDTETAFGARFDMELDAFQMLSVSILVWQSGRIGPWVISIGAIRYLFVTAGWVWLWLQAELPNRPQRKTICVVQGVVLLVSLGPIIPSTLAATAASCALMLLIYSFAIDIRWLTKNGKV